MEMALYCRSGARSGATRLLGGAERSDERALQKNDGAERSAERGVAERERSGERRLHGLGWSVERLFRPLRSHALFVLSAFCKTGRFLNLGSRQPVLYTGRSPKCNSVGRYHGTIVEPRYFFSRYQYR